MAIKGSSRSARRDMKALFIVLLAAAVILCVWILITGGRSSEPTPSSSDVPFIITEIMPDNMSTLKDDAGNYSDWIEIFNASDKEASLAGYYLSDNEKQPVKWEFPAVKVGSRQYIVVFCSGEDRYDPESGYCHTDFRLSSKGESVVLSQPSSLYTASVSFGETLPDASYGLIYTEETGSLEYKWMDDPTPGKANAGTYADSAFLLPSDSVKGVVINEYQTHNTCTLYDSDGDYPDWVELYNAGDEDAELSGCVLTDSETRTGRWYFPDGMTIKAHEYMTVFLSGKDRYEKGELHTSFGLGPEDTEIVLCDRASRMIDRAEIVPLPDDMSYGRGEDGWLYYGLPTPGGENRTRGFASLMSALTVEGKLCISEVCAATKRSYTTNMPDWIELYNGSDETIDLNGYGLGRSALTLREFVFGEKLLGPGEYIVVTAAGDKAAAGEAGFKISTSGSTIYLTDPQETVIDVFNTGKLGIGISSGRLPEESGERRYFAEPTRGKANAAESYTGYAPKPEILSDGGYVKKGTKVRISVPDGAVVRYTTDGSEPGESSPLYEGAVEIGSSMTLKAAAFSEGLLRSDADFVTFLTDEESTIPVICMSGDPEDLFGYGVGIYDFENSIYKDKNASECKVGIEYFVEGKRSLEFTTGARLHGSGSRYYNQKSFALILRDIYGQSSVSYPFFKDSGHITAKALVLRSGGQDQFYTFLRDGFCARMAIKYSENIIATSCQPVTLYINGKYWGKYELREKANEDYFEINYGIAKTDIDIIQHNYIVNAGSYKGYSELLGYMRTHDLNDSETYKYVSDRIDIDSAVDYIVFEHFFKNIDYGNVRLYRDRNGGKWRWIMFDMDISMREGCESVNMGSVHNIYTQDLFIERLMTSDRFREQLLKRYAELLDTAFKPSETLAILNDMAKEDEPEVERTYQRWKTLSYKTWSIQMDRLRERLKVRPDVVKAELKIYFRLNDEEYESYFGKNE